MATTSEEDNLALYTDKMGQEVGPLFLRIKHEFIQIAVKWDFICTIQLSEERWRILQTGLGGFSVVLYWNLYESVVSALMRLLDKKENKVKGGVAENLSLRRLLEVVPKKIYSGVNFQVDELEKACEELRLIRDKILSHNDLDYALGNLTKPQFPSRIETTNKIKSLLRLLNTIEKYFDFEVFESFPFPPNGNDHAFRLLNRLHVVDVLLKKEHESALKSLPDIAISRTEFLAAFGYFREEEKEANRYSLI